MLSDEKNYLERRGHYHRYPESVKPLTALHCLRDGLNNGNEHELEPGAVATGSLAWIQFRNHFKNNAQSQFGPGRYCLVLVHCPEVELKSLWRDPICQALLLR